MELLACATPAGVLAAAPLSALCVSTALERWEGFWAEDDRYYARLTRAGSGVVEWFCLRDVPATAGGTPASLPVVHPVARRRQEKRVRRLPVLFAGPRGASGRRVLWFRAVS